MSDSGTSPTHRALAAVRYAARRASEFFNSVADDVDVLCDPIRETRIAREERDRMQQALISAHGSLTRIGDEVSALGRDAQHERDELVSKHRDELRLQSRTIIAEALDNIARRISKHASGDSIPYDEKLRDDVIAQTKIVADSMIFSTARINGDLLPFGAVISIPSLSIELSVNTSETKVRKL